MPLSTDEKLLPPSEHLIHQFHTHFGSRTGLRPARELQRRVAAGSMRRLIVLLLLFAGVRIVAQNSPTDCSNCAVWNASQSPFAIYGNTYYVGPHGLGSILITSPQGHVLIDGALAESAPMIEANIRALGFQVTDIKLILTTHVHFDHAGGVAELQRKSGAQVLASPWSAQVMKSGAVAKDDPQFGILRPVDAVQRVGVMKDGQTLKVGPIAVTAHFTPGHTPGGTSYTWSSCEFGKCLNLVYVDSVSSVSADGYKFTQHPWAMEGFEKSFNFLETVPCDVLITPHPEASNFWDRMDAHKRGVTPDPLIDPSACKRLAASARESFKKRIESEQGR
jgi:metallo-beta-lactamase class B